MILSVLYKVFDVRSNLLCLSERENILVNNYLCKSFTISK